MGQVIEFPDVSFYQGMINWNIMSAKTKNIIIRLGQGDWVDSRFEDNYIASRAYGMRRGVYFFFDDRYSVNVQVEVIVSMLKKHGLPDTRVWIDWEDLSYHEAGNFKGLQYPVAVMKGVEKAFPGQVVGMYTGYYWFKDHSNPTSNKAEYEYLKWHPYWLAQYTANGESGSLLTNTPPWEKPPELHQWGVPPIGPDYGVGSMEIDMNRVLKNSEIYIEEIPSMYRYKATAIGNGTRIRTGHSTAYTYLNSYPAGTIFEGDEVFTATEQLSNAGGVYQKVGDKWLNIKKVNGQDPRDSNGNLITTEIWVAVVHMGGAICNLVDNGTQPEPPDPTDPQPPQELQIKDEKGIWWRSTTFTKM